MNAISKIFSFLCSQDAARSFAIAGQQLPLCQRCTGVYVGMGISLVFLLLGRYHKKGLPPKGIVYLNIACLLIMPVFGFHLLDPGPLWRLWSGLIFGNAIVFLLLPATAVMCDRVQTSTSWGRASALWFLMLFAFLNAMPLWLPVQSQCVYYAVSALTFTALVGVLSCIVSVAIVWTKKIMALILLKGFGNECAKRYQSRLR
jgi:uncharacterized membrane protein